MSQKIRKSKILKAAIELAESEGYSFVTREMIATRAGVGTGSVNLYFGTMHKLRKKIVSHAVRTGNLTIIAQAIVAKDMGVDSLTTEEKRTALLAVA